MSEITCALSKQTPSIKNKTKHVSEKYSSSTDIKSQRKGVVMFYIYGILTVTMGKQQ